MKDSAPRWISPALRGFEERRSQGIGRFISTAELRKLDNERLTDLVVTIAFYNGLVRLLETMQVDVEEDHLSYLKEFPLPQR